MATQPKTDHKSKAKTTEVQNAEATTDDPIVCRLCNDTGWREDASAAGKTRSVVRCDCSLRARGDRLLQLARIPRRYEHCELAEFHPEVEGSGRESRAHALSMAKRFVEEYPVESTGLMLLGPVGVGKTHLAVGIVRELALRKNIQCLFYDYRELLKQIQNSYNQSVQATEMDVLRPVFESEVLVLDELGATKPTEWVWDTVSLILNTRYNDKRTTIITSNFPNQPPAGAVRDLTKRAATDETLGDRIGERMRSRLQEMCKKVEIQGNDFRQRVRSGSFA